ncbi:MAG: BtrH N-terminal domain-containing protein [Bacteroidetes bacterium]|nr:BtrH N-terminal domain-containing protein [Bacteroidota bacterium]
MITDYKHNYSSHCETGVTSGLLRHKGIDISEPMAMGIGSGIFFTYLPFIKAQDAPMVSFRTAPTRVFKLTTQRLGVKTAVLKKFENQLDAMDSLDRNIKNGIPTGCQVGCYHLTYLPPPMHVHYNFHNVVVFGKEDGLYHVAEPVFEETQILSYEDLLRVRFAKGMFEPKGKMYFVESVTQNPDMKKAIFAGIKTSVKNMVKDPVPLIGVRGMRKLSKHMRNWPNKLPAKNAAFNLIQLIRTVEEFGTGGAAFRYLYGAFLKEAGELLKNDELLKLSFDMGEAGNLWRDLSIRGGRFVKNRGDDNYNTLADIVLECSVREEKIFRALDKIVK